MGRPSTPLGLPKRPILGCRAWPRYAAQGNAARCCACRHGTCARKPFGRRRSEEHTSELQSIMRSSYAVFCLKKEKKSRRSQHTGRCDTAQTRKARERIDGEPNKEVDG